MTERGPRHFHAPWLTTRTTPAARPAATGALAAGALAGCLGGGGGGDGTTTHRLTDGPPDDGDDAVLFGHGSRLKAWSSDLGGTAWETEPSGTLVASVVPAGEALFVVTRGDEGSYNTPATLHAFQ